MTIWTPAAGELAQQLAASHVEDSVLGAIGERDQRPVEVEEEREAIATDRIEPVGFQSSRSGARMILATCDWRPDQSDPAADMAAPFIQISMCSNDICER